MSSRGPLKSLTAAAPSPRLDRFLAEHAPGLSRSAASRLIRESAVLLNGRPGRASDRVATGDVVEYQLPEQRAPTIAAEDIPLEVLYEDGDLVVAVGLAVYVFRNPGSGLTNGVLGLVMGGTLGNSYERLVNGTVTDFINFHFWPVFNVADSAVSIGVVLLIAGYFIRRPTA